MQRYPSQSFWMSLLALALASACDENKPAPQPEPVVQHSGNMTCFIYANEVECVKD